MRQRVGKGHIGTFERHVDTYLVSFIAANPVAASSIEQSEGLVTDITRDGAGSYVLTLGSRFKKIIAIPNIRDAGDTKVKADAITEGDATNKVEVTTISGTAAADTNARVDVVLHLVTARG